MKFLALFTFFVGTPVLLVDAAPTIISENDGTKIQDDINTLRSGVVGSSLHPPSVNSRYVTYNHTVQNTMDAWFAAPATGAVGATNGDQCWVAGDECQSMFNDPQFKALANEGWGWYFFDSTNNSPTAVSGIFEFRAKRQLPCFDYSLCNPNPNDWSDYASCYNVNVSKSVNCNYFNHYLPPLLDPDLSQISCKLTGNPGPYNQKGQPNSFYCVVKLLDETGKPPANDVDYSDQPYVAADDKHKPCSECPEDVPECYENLCIAKAPATRSPTVLLFSTHSPTHSKAPTKKHKHRGLRMQLGMD